MTFIGSFHHLLIWFYRLKFYTLSILRKRSLYKDTGNFDVILFVVFLGFFLTVNGFKKCHWKFYRWIWWGICWLSILLKSKIRLRFFIPISTQESKKQLNILIKPFISFFDSKMRFKLDQSSVFEGTSQNFTFLFFKHRSKDHESLKKRRLKEEYTFNYILMTCLK